ncbi:hypothetical protein PR003_g32412 [Phytophthora rubi]|uniref:Uncharacterized protein n=2 Tax=Phytophthora TaxID=4783 RepID=A0A6G0QN71_9STRA|nr:hypothetical protein PR002_g32170 [Phytophthora rubi]KAE8955592.1 hypothetical protein PR001_g32037 [Phytophthora rubi]KAE9203288.1 hypothetical protein PF004_g18180 [Phytophthora fragariae]KAE9265582.1 hypothetical protein PR003_g32412 [Phytophthora rubi]KAE9295265.1 hypothetical protein PF008_g24313 [Phytophthora fragariae]
MACLELILCGLYVHFVTEVTTSIRFSNAICFSQGYKNKDGQHVEMHKTCT